MRSRRSAHVTGFMVLSRISALVVLVSALGIGSWSSSASAAQRPATPTGLAVTLGVGEVTISWHAIAGTNVSYGVTSLPHGLSCSVSNQTSCTFAVRVSTPWRFAVWSRVDGVASVRSQFTVPYRRRTILILAGESNAEGEESFAVNPSTGANYFDSPYRNGADNYSKIAWIPWGIGPASTSRPVPLDTPQIARTPSGRKRIFGPEIGLARTIWHQTHRAVTIVKATFPGSTLAAQWNPLDSRDLYGRMLAKVHTMMRLDAAAGQFDVIGAIYWYQGGADALAGYGSTYQENLQNLVVAMRRDLPLNTNARIVVAMESIGARIGLYRVTKSCSAASCRADERGNIEVRSAERWVASHIKNVFLVDTQSLPRNNYQLHITDVGELTLGWEFAQVTENHFP